LGHRRAATVDREQDESAARLVIRSRSFFRRPRRRLGAPTPSGPARGVACAAAIGRKRMTGRGRRRAAPAIQAASTTVRANSSGGEPRGDLGGGAQTGRRSSVSPRGSDGGAASGGSPSALENGEGAAALDRPSLGLAHRAALTNRDAGRGRGSRACGCWPRRARHSSSAGRAGSYRPRRLVL